MKDVHRLVRVGVRLVDYPNGDFMVHHISNSSLVVEVKSKQNLDPLLMELKKSVLDKINVILPKGDGVLMCTGC